MNTPVSGNSVTSVSGHKGFTSYLNVTLLAVCYYNVIPLYRTQEKCPHENITPFSMANLW
jgi:hypothetical protein